VPLPVLFNTNAVTFPLAAAIAALAAVPASSSVRYVVFESGWLYRTASNLGQPTLASGYSVVVATQPGDAKKACYTPPNRVYRPERMEKSSGGEVN
jgi:lipoprotein-anchoring transpeptidase ErfK/SrfK